MAAVMMSGGAVLLTILAAVLVGSEGAASIVLKCDEQCHCDTTVKGILKERRIVCNETGSEPVHLTEEVFLPKSREIISQVYVRVERSVGVTITEGFIAGWKGYPSSALDVWDVEFLSLPKNLNDPGKSNPLRHTFAGIGIKGCTVDELPRYLFSGKPKAGLRLIQSTVGIVRADAFSNVNALSYLEVEDSDIGIFKGPANETGRLVVTKEESIYGVWFHNSVIGRIESGVFNLTSFSVHGMLLDNVTIGRLDTDAVVMSNINLVLQNSSVADLQAGALRTEGGGTVRMKNNHIAAQPGALTHLKCSFTDHHITGNYIDVPFSDAEEPVVDSDSDEATNGTETSSEPSYTSPPYKSRTLYELASSRLKQVLDPTCVPYNLPRWATEAACGLQASPRAERQTSDLMYVVLYCLIGICVIAVIATVALSCGLVSSKNRRRRVPDKSPVVLMTQINDPLYEEASNFLMPPPVPAPIQFTPEGKGACGSSQDAATSPAWNGCSSGAPDNSRVENAYMNMR
ncbi:uncharacterized protein LOC135204348 [Macrobrachium nipponense]|uniref:uncharacterized protein LOC135204348 n=1 Tax=Macrobrachium nipponense TaxID=159736 RepID=UPI0030C81C84